MRDPPARWAPEVVKAMDPPEILYNEELEDSTIKAEGVCNYELDKDELEFSVYSTQPETEKALEVSVSAESSPLNVILGTWHTQFYRGETAIGFLQTINFVTTALDEEKLQFQGTNVAARGIEVDWSGSCKKTEDLNIFEVTLMRSFRTRLSPQYWKGKLNLATGNVVGEAYMDESYTLAGFTFLLTRTSPEYLRWRPSPSSLEENKYRSLWNYAISAVIADVRRNSWSWSYFKERGQARRRWVGLSVRSEFGIELSPEESSELMEHSRSFLPADARFYYSLVFREKRIQPEHKYV